jgi:NitT/TauT family transport system permease protein
MTIPNDAKVLFSPRVQRWTLRLFSLCAFALGWELFANNLNSLLMPRFTETLAALVHLLATPLLWEAVWVSNQAMVLGFVLAAVVGVASGLLMGRWRAAEKFLDPYLNILLVTPMSALIPILIMATGLGIVTRVLIVFTFAVVVITVNTRAGLKMIDASWIEMARSFGVTELQLWRKVLLRGAFPAIVTGLRLGLARAISGMIFVELLLLALGIGRLMLDFQGNFDSANLYATVFVVVAEAVVLMQIFGRLERRTARWTGQVVVE